MCNNKFALIKLSIFLKYEILQRKFFDSEIWFNLNLKKNISIKIKLLNKIKKRNKWIINLFKELKIFNELLKLLNIFMTIFSLSWKIFFNESL